MNYHATFTSPERVRGSKPATVEVSCQTSSPAANAQSSNLGSTIFTAAIGVLVTLQAVLELNGRVMGAPSHVSPVISGLLLLMLAAFIGGTSVLSILPSPLVNAVGALLQSRLIDAGRNWKEDALRSFVELFLSISSGLHTFQNTGHLGSSLGCGLLASWAVILGGELYRR